MMSAQHKLASSKNEQRVLRNRILPMMMLLPKGGKCRQWQRWANERNNFPFPTRVFGPATGSGVSRRQGKIGHRRATIGAVSNDDKSLGIINLGQVVSDFCSYYSAL